MIQKNIFQTQKSQDFINSRYKLKIGQDSWKEHETKGFKYHFYNDHDQLLFLFLSHVMFHLRKL